MGSSAHRRIDRPPSEAFVADADDGEGTEVFEGIALAQGGAEASRLRLGLVELWGHRGQGCDGLTVVVGGGGTTFSDRSS